MVSNALRVTPADRSEWLIPVAFTAAIILAVAVGILINTVASGNSAVPQILYRPILFPGMFTIAPIILGAANTLRGGSLVITASVGISPGLSFLLLAWGSELLGISTGGDAPALGLAVVFATAGLGHALLGLCVGIIARKVWQPMKASE